MAVSRGGPDGQIPPLLRAGCRSVFSVFQHHAPMRAFCIRLYSSVFLCETFRESLHKQENPRAKLGIIIIIRDRCVLGVCILCILVCIVCILICIVCILVCIASVFSYMHC